MLNPEQLENAKNYKLSEHFTLYELINSSKYPELVEWPSEEIIEHLRNFCVDILEPIRVQWGRIRVNSGWRNPKLNSRVGGETASIHQIEYRSVYIGVAADIVPMEADLLEVYAWTFEELPAIKNVILYRLPHVTRTPFIHVDNRTTRGYKTQLEKFGDGDYRPYSA